MHQNDRPSTPLGFSLAISSTSVATLPSDFERCQKLEAPKTLRGGSHDGLTRVAIANTYGLLGATRSARASTSQIPSSEPTCSDNPAGSTLFVPLCGSVESLGSCILRLSNRPISAQLASRSNSSAWLQPSSLKVR